MTGIRNPAPRWFTVAAVVLVMWGVMGAINCMQQIRVGAEAMGPATDYDRALYASLPGWYNWLYAAAVGTGLAGSIALLFRSATAVPLYVLSLVGVVAMFGWIFVTTDLIVVKGLLVAAGFPLVILLFGIAQLWLARHARRRGWIG